MTLDEVLIDHIANSTPHLDRILGQTLRPLIVYDIAHQTALVRTLRTYVEAEFNLTKSAEALHVHPNTVMYRLRRVKELCGRDPHDPDDLLFLYLALKVAQLTPAGGAIVRENDCDAVLFEEAVTRIVNVYDPATDGTPLRTPEALRDNPGGSAPDSTDHV